MSILTRSSVLLLAVAFAAACGEPGTPTAPDSQPSAPSLDVEETGWQTADESAIQSVPEPVVAAAPAAIFQFFNGSFETGDYTGWTLYEGLPGVPIPTNGTWGIAANGQTVNYGQSVFDFFDGINVPQFSPGLPHTYAATDGNYVAFQLQNGPQTHRMFQDIALSTGVTTISWEMEYNNHSAGGFSASQQIAINIRNPANDAILATPFVTTQGVDPPAVAAMTTYTVDVSAFGGQTVRFSVDMSVGNFYFDAAFDNFRVDIISVDIDIKPGSDPNSINCTNEKEVIAVAVLTTTTFDATTVDHTTVAFEGATETHIDKKTGLPRRHEEDVDGDGDIDLVFHFQYADTSLSCASTEGMLTGQTSDGVFIQGTDAVRMVGG